MSPKKKFEPEPANEEWFRKNIDKVRAIHPDMVLELPDGYTTDLQGNVVKKKEDKTNDKQK